MNRSGTADRLARQLPEVVRAGILKDVENTSLALQLGNVHRMTAFQERFVLQNSKPTVSWLNGTTGAGDAPHGSSNNDDTNQAAKDSALKQTTSFGYENLTITPDEVAVLVPIPDAWIDDSNIQWSEIASAVRGAFAEAIDLAVFWGASPNSHPLPSTFGDGVVVDTIAEGAYVGLAGIDGTINADGTRNDRADAYMQAAQSLATRGYRPGNFVVAPGEDWNLKRQRDENGLPLLANGQIFGLGASPAENGTWDATTAVALAGDFSHLHIGIRQDLTMKLFDQGIIHDADGSVVYNAMQQDGKVLRAVMRVGYVVTNPLKNITGEREWPFQLVVPGASAS